MNKFDLDIKIADQIISFLQGNSMKTAFYIILFFVIFNISSEEKIIIDFQSAKIEKLKNIHPRLYLDNEKIIKLKELIKEEPYKSFFSEVKAVADQGIKKGPPKDKPSDGSKNDEQLWQREVGNMIPHLAMTYLLTGEKKYLDKSIDYINTSLSYKTWGTGKYEGLDLPAAHQIYGISLAYDWLYSDLSGKQKVFIKNALSEKTKYVFDAMTSGKIWWHKANNQNHQWVNMCAIGTCGLAFYGEEDDAGKWIKTILEKFKTSISSFGDDGASHEGVSYWAYGVEYLLKFMDLGKDLLDYDFFKDSTWFKNTAFFRIYSSLPVNYLEKNSTTMSFADAPRSDWYGPDYLLKKLAHEYNNGYAQYLSDILDQKDLNVTKNGCFLNLLWYDPEIKPLSFENLPDFRHFNDIDIVLGRSDWNGNETMYAFKCGPYIGHKNLKEVDYDTGGGHVHPDAGSFQIFSFGEWLIVDDGYAFKMTEYQNTALINGTGQTGEGKNWFDGDKISKTKKFPNIEKAVENPDYHYIKGNLTNAYKDGAKLVSYKRHFIYLKPNVWVIFDDFENQNPSRFELYFHSDFEFKESNKSIMNISGNKGSLNVNSVYPKDTSFEIIKDQEIKNVKGKKDTTLNAMIISNKEKEKKIQFINILESFPTGGKSKMKYSLNEETENLTLKIIFGKKEFEIVFPKNGKDEVKITKKSFD